MSTLVRTRKTGWGEELGEDGRIVKSAATQVVQVQNGLQGSGGSGTMKIGNSIRLHRKNGLHLRLRWCIIGAEAMNGSDALHPPLQRVRGGGRRTGADALSQP